MRGWQNGRRSAAVVALAFAAALASVSTAMASASVTNRDETDHKITLIEGEKKTDYTLKPNQALENICPQGCVLRLNDNDDDEYQIDPADVVSIEDGALYYDEPDDKPEEPKKN